MARILISTFGSLGDLHPYIALGKALLARGHTVTLGTHGPYQAKIEREGLGFRCLAPMPEPGTPEYQNLVARAMHRTNGPEFVFREMVMPNLRQAYADTLAAAEEHDLLVSHPLTLAVPLVAEKTNKPWAATALAPLSFFSMTHPPAVGMAIWDYPRHLGSWLTRPLFSLVKWKLSGWTGPYRELRRELGLPGDPHPVFEGQWSPHLNLALFSPHFGPPRPDWPAKTVVPGFCFYDRDDAGDMTPALQAFLASGPPPVVFTLGSSAVRVAGGFYREAIAAVAKLRCRAVLLVGKDAGNELPDLPETIHVAGYAPYSALFPSASAIVHQGGVGTTAQALRSGRPMLVVPHAHDQPDNAENAGRLGVGRTLPSHRFTAARAVEALRPLLEDARYAQAAEKTGAIVRAEDGPNDAARTLEGLLG